MPVRDLLMAASGTGGATDPYFYDVSLLLNGDGTNGAQNNTFLDSSTNNFTITRNGNTTQGSFSPYGNLWSNYFVGTSGGSASPNYLTTPSSSVWAFGTGAFTLECWGYLTSAPDVANGWNFFDFRTGTSLTVGWQNDQMYTYDGTNTITSSSVSSYLNKWTHWAWMRSGTTVYLFANGVVIGSGSMSTNFGTSASVCTINARYSGSQSAGGFFSNARVSNIARYATTGFTPATTNFTNDANTLLLTMQNNRFIDNSSNAFTLTVNGTPQVQRFSPFNPTAPYSTSVIGGSGYVSANSYITTPTNAALTLGSGNYTVECWVNISSFTANGGIMEVGAPGSLDNSTWGLEFNASSNSLGLFIYNANNSIYIITPSQAISGQGWIHVAVVRNGTTTTMYYNGVSVGTYTGSYTVSGGNPWYIGVGFYAPSSRTTTGYITDARIVVGTAVYTSTFTPPTAPLTAITNTQLLLSYTNAGIPDLAMQNDLQTVGSAQVSTSVKKYGTGSLYIPSSGGSYLVGSLTPNIQFGTGDFTIECWTYLTSSATSYPTIFSNYNSYTTGQLGINAGGASTNYYQVSVNGTTYPAIQSSTTISFNTWVHIAVVRYNGTITLYINGTANGTYNASGVTLNGVGSQFAIGTSPDNTSGDYLNGYIDDFRITKGYARYTANFTPPTSALPTY